MDLVKFNKERVSVAEALNENAGNEVLVAGWVHNSRDLSKIKFILVRDTTGVLQVVGIKGETDKDIFDKMDKISRESVVIIKGKLVDSKQAPGGKELNPTSLEVVAEAEDLQIDVTDYSKTELSKRLDYRFLDLHRRKIQAIFRVQSTIAKAFREYFAKEGFVEIFTPSIIGSSSEGGTELFKARYFEKDAFLAQSPQLYKQMLACSMEKVTLITPVWRAEKHNTPRHLNEARQMDIEMAFADAMVVMKELENVVKYIVKIILEENKEELELLEVKDLKVPKGKYMTFKEVADLMKKEKIEMGEDDLSGEAERKLGELFPNEIVFVYDWPLSGKPFYIMPKEGKADAELSEGFDAIYKGMEITSGGQRIHIPELLEKRLKAKGLKPKDFKSYVDSFRFGAPPHAGWSIGLERLTMLILGLNNIREAVLFPRDRDRLGP